MEGDYVSSGDGDPTAEGNWNLDLLYSIFDKEALEPWLDRDEAEIVVPGISTGARQSVHLLADLSAIRFSTYLPIDGRNPYETFRDKALELNLRRQMVKFTVTYDEEEGLLGLMASYDIPVSAGLTPEHVIAALRQFDLHSRL